jgi:hypothetical protein
LGCDCGHSIAAEIQQAIDVAQDPDLVELFFDDKLDVLVCPKCQKQHRASAPIVFHDPRIPVLALWLPPALRYRELQLTASYLTMLSEERVDVPDYAKRPYVIFDADALRALLAEPAAAVREADRQRDGERLRAKEDELARREEEVLGREEDLLGREEKLVGEKDKIRDARRALENERADLDREREAMRALSVDLAAREEALRKRRAKPPALPPEVLRREETTARVELDLAQRPQHEVDKWRASDERTALFVKEGRYLAAARPGVELLGKLTESAPNMRIQLHQLQGGPLVSLAASIDDFSEPDQVLFWTVDPSSDLGEGLLAQMAQEFTLHLDLYDEESRSVATWELREPLEKNVQLIREQLNSRDKKADRPFGERVKRFAELGDSRLGRKQHNFSEDSFIDLPSPAAARLALGIISYWSEPENQEYLLFIKAFPAKFWGEIRTRVVRAALEFGLRLGPHIMGFAERAGLVAGRNQALHMAMSNFAEVSLRLKPCDLDPAHEWENWKLLLADCVEAGVPVESQIEELAAACARKARDASVPIEDETAPGGDLTTLEEQQLLELLEDRGQRRDAVLELCDRGLSQHGKAVYDALRAMGRDEVARVIPAMLQLGESVVPLFVQGLAHRKSFIRQGCALALGSLRASEAPVAPLLEMLLREPTRIWMEAARAIGDLGTLALPAVMEAVEKADGEGRERLAWALAHIALDDDGRAAVREQFGESTVAGSKKIAWRALQMVDYVRQNDEEVRGQKPLTDHTIVRRFTRRFFESMGDDKVNELSEDDILEQAEDAEDIDDGDILSADILDSRDDLPRSLVVDESVEVSETDILEN